MLDYYFYLLMGYLGLAAGWFLHRIASEEVLQYRKSLTAMKLGCVLAIFGLLMNLSSRQLFVAVAFAGYLTLLLSDRSRYAYAILPLFLYSSFGLPAVLPWIASLVFLYGFPEGSFQATEHGLLDILKNNYWFLLTGLLLGIIL